MSLPQAKEHTGAAETGPLELFCSPLGIPQHTSLCLIPSLSLVQAALQGVLQGSLAGFKQAELCKREACITGALITNSWAVSSRLILLPCEEGTNHIKGTAMPSPTKQALLQPPASGGTSHCAHNVIQLQLRTRPGSCHSSGGVSKQICDSNPFLKL